MDLKKHLAKNRDLINKRLDRYLPKRGVYPSIIHDAMRYMVLSPGKRIRPILALEACRVCGGDVNDAMPAAAAMELIHTYSLVHDDLPSMDDAPMRRGRKSCHVKYGEANAILAGDALLTLAFGIIAGIRSPLAAQKVLRDVSRAAGSYGMVGGQVADIAAKGKKTDLPLLEYINTHKTGALIAASLQAGATIAGADSRETGALLRYGKYIGLAFQIADDAMDGEGYADIFGVKGARDEARRLVERAKKSLDIFGKKADTLKRIADFVYERKH